MSDSDEAPKKAGVPSWQLKSKEDSKKEAEEPVPETQSRERVIEQAKKFLEEDEVRDAPKDKKIAFLESKGLQSDEIEGLLGISRNAEATATAPEESSLPESSQQPLQTPQTSQAPPPTQQSYTPQASSPPIITYPEFLTTPPHPTPLVTRRRLLTTLYLFSGLSALLYGTNTYLVTPMLASLTESRLSLSSTASTNLQKLISKLETMVSEIPSTTKASVPVHNEREDDESSDEDPTEMFHRDIGVQTSLPTSPTSSRPGSPPPTSNTTLEDQTKRLASLKSSMSELLEDSTSEGHDVQELEATISILREYLDSMAYVTPNYGYGGGYGNYGGSAGGAGKEADDEIGKVKASIRGVKGVLLNARSFPGGVRAGVR